MFHADTDAGVDAYADTGACGQCIFRCHPFHLYLEDLCSRGYINYTYIFDMLLGYIYIS